MNSYASKTPYAFVFLSLSCPALRFLLFFQLGSIQFRDGPLKECISLQLLRLWGVTVVILETVSSTLWLLLLPGILLSRAGCCALPDTVYTVTTVLSSLLVFSSQGNSKFSSCKRLDGKRLVILKI